MNNPALPYLNAFRNIPIVGRRALEALVAHFGSAEAAWHASNGAIAACPGLTPTVIARITEARPTLDPEQLWEVLAASGIEVFVITDPDYPALLREAADAPYLLYVRGNFDWNAERFPIAMVGSRKFTPYGEQAALRLSEELTRAGILVVSGLAFGIDSKAHQAALEAGGETLAVLGGGIADTDIAPRSQVPLAKKVMEHGALVSEHPPGAPVLPQNFAIRNRIIAGLSLGTVVIEAAEESGSLITADLALQYDRDVFALPGSIFSPSSTGTNALIKKGAKLVTSVQDILDELPVAARSTPATNLAGVRGEEASEDEAKILKALSHEPLHVDKIIKGARLETAQVITLLTMLELRGFVKNIGGMQYIRL